MARGNPPLDLVLAINKLSALLVLSKLLLMDSSISRNSFSHKPKYYNHGQSSGLCPPGGNNKINRASSWFCMKCTVFFFIGFILYPHLLHHAAIISRVFLRLPSISPRRATSSAYRRAANL